MPAVFLALASIGAMVASLLAVPSDASAQSYPVRSVRLIVPFAAGGPTDVIARIVAPVANTPAEFGERIRAETVRWSKVVRDANIRAD